MLCWNKPMLCWGLWKILPNFLLGCWEGGNIEHCQCDKVWQTCMPGSLIVGVKMTGNQFVPAGETTFQVIPRKINKKDKKYDKNSLGVWWCVTISDSQILRLAFKVGISPTFPVFLNESLSLRGPHLIHSHKTKPCPSPVSCVPLVSNFRQN